MPTANIIQLETSTSESISRDEYNQSILLPIKKSLIEKNLASKAFVLVTFYGIPLSIQDTAAPENAESLKIQLAARTKELQQRAVAGLQKLKVLGGNMEDKSEIDLNKLTTEQLAGLINNAKSSLIGAKSDQKALEGLMQTIGDLIGLKGVLAGGSGMNPEMKSKITKEVASREAALKEVQSPSNSADLDKYLSIQKELLGTLVSIKVATSLGETLFSTESGASVDSDLPLLKVQPGGAPLTNRLASPLFIEDISSMKSNKRAVPNALKGMILVSRLDAATPELVKSIIKNGIETEREQSLKGNFLVDSRGLPREQKDTYGEWDRDLVKLARNIKVGSRFDVEFDGNEQLAGETEDIALYSGWYSLRNYENLYKFSKGAIAFHIASEEAVSLRESEEKGWCKNLLDRGVVATLGAVSEPYLDSFPKPNDFFTLLLSGKYQLVEVYYLTAKYMSWKMVLVGDPLYKPISEKTAREEFDYDTEDYNELPIAPSVLMRN